MLFMLLPLLLCLYICYNNTCTILNISVCIIYALELYISHNTIYTCILYSIGVGCNKRLQSMMGDMVRERGASLCAMDYRLVYYSCDIHM